MKNGLPTVPVFDIQIHPREHDLILATHGRSFWIMDNISALEEMNDQVLTSGPEDVRRPPGHSVEDGQLSRLPGHQQLFPRAERAQRACMVDYFAKAAGPVRIDRDG